MECARERILVLNSNPYGRLWHARFDMI
ncbi:MAG: HtrA2 peptidase, partial [Parcubacteria group bacterium Greene0714_4]